MAVLPQGLSKAELQRIYAQKFRNSNLHHLIPRSRGGETNEFNLFPYQMRSHDSYHTIFLNMTIWEVWEKLEEVHGKIFDKEEEVIARDWLIVCELEGDNEKRSQVVRGYRAEFLQDKWIRAFGGDSVQQAKKILRHMMLFIIFGSQMADSNRLFDNGNLTEFFEEYPANDDRLRAFNICFGESADWHRIKSRISKILNN